MYQNYGAWMGTMPQFGLGLGIQIYRERSSVPGSEYYGPRQNSMAPTNNQPQNLPRMENPKPTDAKPQYAIQYSEETRASAPIPNTVTYEQMMSGQVPLKSRTKKPAPVTQDYQARTF